MDVQKVNKLHEKSMEFADLAFVARRFGNDEESKTYFSQAYEYEAEAAKLLVNTNIEPSRSVLHRSAASLALDCGLVREAEKLIAIALAGEPPDEIADELRDLLEQANFARHLNLKGISLQSGEFQLSLAGNAIGYGIALTEVVIQRVSRMEKIIQRTVERMSNQKYREHGNTSRSVLGRYNVYLSAPRSGSFSLTLKLGRLDQPMLPTLDDTDNIIDEVMECISLVNVQNFELLNKKIPDPAYYRNFVGLAKSIAPDGEKVSIVGLTSMRQGQEVKIDFTRTQDEIQTVPKTESQERLKLEEVGEPQEITGVLKYANSMNESQVKLIDGNNKTWTIIVPEGLMSDIVKPYFEENITITGLKIKGKNKTLRLQDIRNS